MDLILVRGLERLVIAAGAIFFGYLGYKLYALGIDKGKSQLSTQGPFLAFAMSGTGPGLVFMTFGAFVLSLGLVNGGSSAITHTVDVPGLVTDDNPNPKIAPSMGSNSQTVTYYPPHGAAPNAETDDSAASKRPYLDPNFPTPTYREEDTKETEPRNENEPASR